jgi:hypothetical protein
MRNAGSGEKWVCGFLRLGVAEELVSVHTDEVTAPPLSAPTLLGMRCAHPDEFVPHWPPDGISGNHVP